MLWVIALWAVAADAAAAERVMVGYYATFGDLPVEQIPWKRLTHVCHAFLRVDADGAVAASDAVPNPSLTADARRNGVRALVSLGGGQTLRGLEKATASDAALGRLVEAIGRVVVDGGYDGVDIDWEFPRNAATRDGFTRLVRALRAELDRVGDDDQRLLLTAAVSASDFFGQWIDAEEVVPRLDWLNVMTYDMSGPWARVAAHPAPLLASSADPESGWRSVSAAMRYWQDRGAPREKLVVGVPLFGRAMPVDQPHAVLDPNLAAKHRAVNFSEIAGLVREGWSTDWDDESGAAWLRRPRADRPDASPLAPVDAAPSGEPGLIGYDHPKSVQRKTAWARARGYRGVFFWALHQDRMPDGRHWLVDAAHRAWPAGPNKRPSTEGSTNSDPGTTAPATSP